MIGKIFKSYQFFPVLKFLKDFKDLIFQILICKGFIVFKLTFNLWKMINDLGLWVVAFFGVGLNSSIAYTSLVLTLVPGFKLVGGT